MAINEVKHLLHVPSTTSYSYDEMRKDLLDLIRSMGLLEFQPDAILGITRGGLIPATMLSHYYDVPMIPVNLSLRDFKSDFDTVANEIDQSIRLDSKLHRNILVIDDILDSGETIKQLYQIFQMFSKFNHFDIKSAVLHYNVSNQAKFVPDFYARKIDKSVDDSWIIYDFEAWWKN